MPVVASYWHSVSAAVAAEYVRAHGIPCRIVLSRGGGLIGESHELVVPERDHVGPAQRLLASFGEEAPEFEEALSEAAEPDLRKLNRKLAPECPACGKRLPLENGVASCPACAEEVDVAALVVARHGPEALAPCYSTRTSLDEATLRGAPVPCPACGYNLAGLPGKGTCPECAAEYDKDEFLRG